MGKKSGLVCLGLGALFVVAAAFSAWYAYPRLAQVPLDHDTRAEPSVSIGTDATYLDRHQATPQIVTGGELQSVRRVVGQVEDSKAASEELDDDIAVWETLSYTDRPGFDPDTDGDPLSGTFDRVAFDRHTGEAVECCDTYTESAGTRTDIDFEGLYFKFPFDTQKQAYEFWDGTVREATPATYEGEEEIDGLTVYKFVQTIEPTDVDQQTAGAEHTEVPGYLVDEGANAPAVQADRIYSNVRTLWVEPETGVIIKAQEDQRSTLEVNGQERAVITDVTIGYTDDTVSHNVDEWSSKATQLTIIRVWIPLYGGIVGGALLVVGLWLWWRGSRTSGRRVADS